MIIKKMSSPKKYVVKKIHLRHELKTFEIVWSNVFELIVFYILSTNQIMILFSMFRHNI